MPAVISPTSFSTTFFLLTSSKLHWIPCFSSNTFLPLLPQGLGMCCSHSLEDSFPQITTFLPLSAPHQIFLSHSLPWRPLVTPFIFPSSLIATCHTVSVSRRACIYSTLKNLPWQQDIFQTHLRAPMPRTVLGRCLMFAEQMKLVWSHWTRLLPLTKLRAGRDLETATDPSCLPRWQDHPDSPHTGEPVPWNQSPEKHHGPEWAAQNVGHKGPFQHRLWERF